MALYKTGSVYLNGEIRRKHQARPWIRSAEVGEGGVIMRMGTQKRKQQDYAVQNC